MKWHQETGRNIPFVIGLVALAAVMVAVYSWLGLPEPVTAYVGAAFAVVIVAIVYYSIGRDAALDPGVARNGNGHAKALSGSVSH